MVLAKKILNVSSFKGEPKLTDFEVVEEELPELKDGEILIEAFYLSVDPYMRPYMKNFPVGSLMIGGQGAKYENTFFYSKTYKYLNTQFTSAESLNRKMKSFQ